MPELEDIFDLDIQVEENSYTDSSRDREDPQGGFSVGQTCSATNGSCASCFYTSCPFHTGWGCSDLFLC